MHHHPATTGNFELNLGFIHLLTSFSSRASEYPHKHLKEFYVICDGMRPHGVIKNQMNLKTFPFLTEGRHQGLALLPSSRFRDHMEGNEEEILGKVLSSFKSSED